MIQMTRSTLKNITALLEFRIVGWVCKSYAVTTLVLIFSIFTGSVYAQEEKASVTDMQVTLDAPDEGSISQSITIDWAGPGEKGDVIAVAEVGSKKTINKTLTTRGNPLTVQMPAEPGEYELRYILRQGRTVLATRPIKVTAVEVTLDAPDEADIGSSVSVNWVGPGVNGDVIAVAEVGSKKTINKTLTTRGSPLTVQMPVEPGEYELRYILRQKRTVLATRPIKVAATEVTLNAPGETSIGSSVSINWVGPGVKGDVIALAEVGSKKTISKTPVTRGNPLTVQMPVEPGEYELRYILRQGRTILATQPITVKSVEVVLDAPDVATAGESVSINWVGRQAERDVIAIARVGDKRGINPVYTPREGPLTIRMPIEPGEYEIRYMLYKNFTILATRPITVKKVEIILNAPDEAITGESINVDWVGPNKKRDVIAVAKIGEKKSINKMGTSYGKPADLRMPTEPGEYELRYLSNGGSTILASQPITVHKMTLDAPDEARVGELVPVSWAGPGGKYDSFFVVETGKQQPSVRVAIRGGSPFGLRMPVTPGEYEIRYAYYYGGKHTLLATRPVTVKAAKIVLDAPSEVSVGESFSITWVGPDENGDTIEIGKPGVTEGITGSDTSGGNPLKILLPTEPGEYELRYVLQQNRTVLATRPLIVNDAEIVLDAPNEANTSESVSIDWVGPAAEGDVIAVAKIGKENTISTAPTSRGSPLTIEMPEAPGEYELRYILQQGNTILATRPITVKETGGMLSVPISTPLYTERLTAMIAVVLIFLILPI